ncbi:MAG: UDP-N-acetylmuramoyl-tripeptide--D-alanyl-D-alanine ligase [Acidobacteria bacterium]|nr:UDP-N-acetylmuramoyl-tripeptide--D-alanyl-D-alanine ligase [Acidobacteriota bacterium]MCA1651034.1 UDP-N-acetylmuramoyl-tripeptide--D-alanyl-D-alanine ligase [Acidobacteriota bacterium]
MNPLPINAGDIAAATGGRLISGEPGQPVGRISIDSRSIGAGDLFVAIRGDRFDGHQFVAEALAHGAMGALVGEVPAVPDASARPAPVLIRAGDTTRALQDLARDVRKRSGAQVVAITGSAGKTTTKEIAADFLSARYRVFRNKGNLNNHIGLPLSLLELRTRPQVAVVELGMNHPGEIRTLVGIAEPNVRVWTNVGDAHLGFFASPDAIAEAKAEILEGARQSDVLVANANDARVMQHASAFRGRTVTFGLDTPADVEATSVEHRGLFGTRARLRTQAGEAVIETALLGLGNLSNVLAATAVALQFEVPLADVIERAARLRPAPRRGELLRLPGGITLLDESYNSSPAALKRALETMAASTGSARKVAILGEMLELGSHTERLHSECGRAAAGAGIDLLIAVGGPPARALADAAADAGIPSRCVSYSATNHEAADLALQRVRPGDLILVKGSRGIGTDLVVERLKAEFA